ncbi:MAG: hypothetical protein K8T89_06645, partial [Planctomycetes bacterium]|nr:hypothetical protein [Planctomycetota bacterium]
AEQFGYVKDRQHVAGFHPHGLSDVPDPVPQPGKSLQLSSIELVGLLRDKPVVYVSENIPAMSELSKAPTRPLDSFEQQGVELFKKGEDLHIQEMPSSLRVIGAIRNAQQCVKCHGGERGDLLGAFSYVLK